MFGMGMYEMMIIGVIAIVLFGSKLPEVARSVGASYHEFRKGLTDIQSQVSASYHGYDTPSYKATATEDSAYEDYDDYEEATAPKFEPPPSE
ncbi:MAG: twin-arginine translocase TatA/TatE family subunit [Planctomycetales bacterium]|nr:twin-arginine translocase TatA/TatE family subunit [Planctomycetales bacterium]